MTLGAFWKRTSAATFSGGAEQPSLVIQVIVRREALGAAGPALVHLMLRRPRLRAHRLPERLRNAKAIYQFR